MVQRQVVCTRCGSVNRLPPERAADAARCGKCKTALFAGHPSDVDGENLERQITRGTIPVLVDVWAPWCGPCRAMAPAYEAAAREFGTRVRAVKLNSDAHPAAANRYGIRGIPTMILFVAGKEAARVSGAMSSGQIVEWARDRLTASPG